MEHAKPIQQSSLIDVFRALSTNARTFLRQEVQLAKVEISEKIARVGKNAFFLAMGAGLAGAGGIVLLLGLGWLAGYGLRAAGVNPLLASSVGIIGVGFVILVLGAGILFRGLSMLKHERLAPERTMQTLQELKGPTRKDEPRQTSRPSSEEMQARVEATEGRMGESLNELGRRLGPEHLKAQLRHRIETQPYRSGLIAMAMGVVGGLILRRSKR